MRCIASSHSLGKLSLELSQGIGGAIAHSPSLVSSIGLGVGLNFLDTGSAMVGGMEFEAQDIGQGVEVTSGNSASSVASTA